MENLLPRCATTGCEFFVANSSDFCSACNRLADRHSPDTNYNTSESRRRSYSQTRCNCGATCTIRYAVGHTGHYYCVNGGHWTESLV